MNAEPLSKQLFSDTKNATQLVRSYQKIAVTIDCVIFGYQDGQLKVLLIKSDLENYTEQWSLLGNEITHTETTDEAAYRVLKQRTGLSDVFLDQVKCFSTPDRHPGGRVVTVAYCSLINIAHHQLTCTDNDLHWHPVQDEIDWAFDHKEIFETCYGWLQKRIQEHPLGFSLLPEKFSLRELQGVYEAILGMKLDRRNFRKKFFTMDFLEDTGEMELNVAHRPGKLYTFNYKKYESGKKDWVGIDF
jgi:8-oxo-dGTP diphosphatase